MGVRKRVGMKFFVCVSLMKDIDTILPPLSGQLQAKSRSDAEVEAGKYRDWLNEGQEMLGPTYFVVRALTEAEVKAIPNSDSWSRGRLAPSTVEKRQASGKPTPNACPSCEGTGLVVRPVCGREKKMLCGKCKGRGTVRPYAKTT